MIFKKRGKKIKQMIFQFKLLYNHKEGKKRTRNQIYLFVAFFLPSLSSWIHLKELAYVINPRKRRFGLHYQYFIIMFRWIEAHI